MLDASYEVTGISSPLGDFFLAKFPQGSPYFWGQLTTQQDLKQKILEKFHLVSSANGNQKKFQCCLQTKRFSSQTGPTLEELYYYLKKSETIPCSRV